MLLCLTFQLGVTPLPDNDPLDKYYYEIIVSTGCSLDAGTDSKVQKYLTYLKSVALKYD